MMGTLPEGFIRKGGRNREPSQVRERPPPPKPMGQAVQAFIAVSPRGHRIPSTIRSTADEAWAVLRASISESDDLHEAGWRIHRLECR